MLARALRCVPLATSSGAPVFVRLALSALPAPGAVAAMSDAPRAKRRATAAEKGKGPVVGSAADAAQTPLSRDDVRALVARLDRGALEALLADAVADSVAPTADSLRAALPTRLRAPALARTAVGDSALLVEAGPFAALSVDLTLAIFDHLSLEDKLMAFTVCRGWRSLRLRPEAWTTLHVPAAKWISGAGALRLLEWAPAACSARSVAIDSSARDSRFSVAVVNKLITSLTAVEELQLRDKVNEKCMQAIVKKHGARLKKLALYQWIPDKTFESVVRLVAGCPELRKLTLGSSVLGFDPFLPADPGLVSLVCGIDDITLRVLTAAIIEARNGGSSLLTSLRAVVSVKALGGIGTTFPELNSLELPRFMVNAAAGRGLHFNSNYPAVTAEAEAEGDGTMSRYLPSAADIAPLTRLERLAINFVGERYYNSSPGTVAAVLARFLPKLCTPRLKQLSLLSGVKSPSAVPCPIQHLAPGIAAGLHTLMLRGFNLGGGGDGDDEMSDDATGALSPLQQLRMLSLDGCSGSAAYEACAAVARCPSLKALKLANITFTAAEGALLPPKQLKSLTLERCGAAMPAALVMAARSGAMAALVTLSLVSPSLEPHAYDAFNGGPRRVEHDMNVPCVFDPSAPFPSLLSLRLNGADMSTAQWARLVAPELCTIELVWGPSTRSAARDGLKRTAAEWEAVRAAVAAAVAAKCPRAAVVVTEEAGRSIYDLLGDGPATENFFF